MTSEDSAQLAAVLHSGIVIATP